MSRHQSRNGLLRNWIVDIPHLVRNARLCNVMAMIIDERTNLRIGEGNYGVVFDLGNSVIKAF